MSELEKPYQCESCGSEGVSDIASALATNNRCPFCRVHQAYFPKKTVDPMVRANELMVQFQDGLINLSELINKLTDLFPQRCGTCKHYNSSARFCHVPVPEWVAEDSSCEPANGTQCALWQSYK